MSSPSRGFLPKVLLTSAAFLAVAGIVLLTATEMKVVGAVLLFIAVSDLVLAFIMSRRV